MADNTDWYEYMEEQRRKRGNHPNPSGPDLGGTITDPLLLQMIQSQLQNGGFANSWISTGHSFSETDYWKMQYELNQIQSERQWQQEYFDRNQSIQAQVDQMRQAGLNPALMYGSGASVGTTSSSSSPDTPSVGGNSPGTDCGRCAVLRGRPSVGGNSPGTMDTTNKMSAVMSILTSLLGQGASFAQSISGINRNKVMNEKDDAQAGLFREQQNTEKDKQNQLAAQALYDRSRARLNEIDANYRDSMNKWQVETQRQEYYKTLRETQKILSDIEVNDSVIKINGKQLEILDKNLSIQEQELQLKTIQVAMKNNELLMQPDMLELQKQYLEAQVLTEEARTDAEEARANATKALWDAMVKKDIVDSGYYEQQVKNLKTQNTMSIINGVVDGVCKISSEALGWATFGVSKIGNKTESSIIQPAYGGPHPTISGMYQ